MMLANVFLLLTRSLASAHRIAEILDENIVLTSPENGVKKVKDGSIDFENVSFKYREDAREYALENVNLHIQGRSDDWCYWNDRIGKDDTCSANSASV